MAMKTGGKGINSEINITPLIDIVLVMLIIFMVMTPLLSQQIEVVVPLTEEVEVDAAVLEEQMVLRVAGDGSLKLNDDAVARDELAGRLRGIFDTRKDKVLFFDADEAANYGDSVSLMDLARASGVKMIGIMTQEPEPVTAGVPEAVPAPPPP